MIFRDYFNIYDIQQVVNDNFTVRIYYKGRLAKLALDGSEKVNIDDQLQENTEDQEEKVREKVKSKWARVEAIVGSEKRLKESAQDIVNHFEKRIKATEGKVIVVCMSRRNCVDLYEQIVKLKPEWHDENDKKGAIKVIMTGSAFDPLNYQQHIRNKGKLPVGVIDLLDAYGVKFPDIPILSEKFLDEIQNIKHKNMAIELLDRLLKNEIKTRSKKNLI